MRFRKLSSYRISGVVLALGLIAPALGQSPPPMPPLRARLIANFQRDQAALQDYTHREHVLVDKDGTADARTLKVWYVRGHEVQQTIALDQRSLSPEEIEAERQRALRRARDAESRPATSPGVIQFEGQNYSFAKLADDYVYTPDRTERWRGREIWVYRATPNPAAPRSSRAETILLHSQGEIWVDAEDQHVMRITVHTTAPVKYGLGVLATIHSASLDLWMERAAPELWLPASASFHVQATILLLKSLSRSKQQNFSEWTKSVGYQ